MLHLNNPRLDWSYRNGETAHRMMEAELFFSAEQQVLKCRLAQVGLPYKNQCQLLGSYGLFCHCHGHYHCHCCSNGMQHIHVKLSSCTFLDPHLLPILAPSLICID